MNAQRRNEITGSIVAITAVAAVATGLLATRDAYAAPTKTKQKSTVKVQRAKKPVYVKMVGDRRAAQSRADQLYAQTMSNIAAEREAQNRIQEENNAANNNSVVVNNGNDPNYPSVNAYEGVGGLGQGSLVSPTYGNGFVFGSAGYPGVNYGPNGSYTTNTVVYPGGLGFGFGNYGFNYGTGFQIGNYSPTGISFYQF